jgi:hypothetical protein
MSITKRMLHYRFSKTGLPEKVSLRMMIAVGLNGGIFKFLIKQCRNKTATKVSVSDKY